MIPLGFRFGLGIVLSIPLMLIAFVLTDYIATWAEQQCRQYRLNKRLGSTSKTPEQK